MPFFNASSRDQSMSEAIDAISVIELLIEEHQNHEIIIGGDLNTKLKGESAFDPLWFELMDKNSFAYCDRFISSPQHTYNHESLSQKKFLDHFVVSESLISQNLIFDHQILEDGDNVSDHLPLLMRTTLKVQPNLSGQIDSSRRPTLNWKKVPNSKRAEYASRLEELLLRRAHSRSVSYCQLGCL